MRPAVLMAGLVAACTTSLPESNPDFAVANGTGVGFGDYGAYQRAQTRAAQPVAPIAPVISPEPVAPRVPEVPAIPAVPVVRGQGALDPAIAAAVERGAGASGQVYVPPATPVVPVAPVAVQPTVAQAPVVQPAPYIQNPVTPVAVQPVEPAVPAAPPATPRVAAAPGISDEQDFDAVSERETIESDAARLERLRLERTVVQPEALPDRERVSTGPNLVAYALKTTNAVGQPVWRRTTVFAQKKYDRNCGAYATPDRAQEAFLAMGGPSRDKKGLDPDGDGFACDWSPAPFRAAVGR